MTSRRGGALPRRPKRIADAWGNDLRWPVPDRFMFDEIVRMPPLEVIVQNFRDRIEPSAYIPVPASDSFDWIAGNFASGGRQVTRSAEEAARWNREAMVYYDAHRRVELAAADAVSGRISVSKAVEIVRTTTEGVLRVFGPVLGGHWSWIATLRTEQPKSFWHLLESARTRRPERPEFVSTFELSQDARDRIGRTGVGRWHVALTEILRAAIRVDPLIGPASPQSSRWPAS